MIGITLDAEQIRTAPAPVRAWIEQQVLASLGLAQNAAPAAHSSYLTTCTEAEAAAVLNRIRAVPSAVSVFFEFARPGMAYGEPPVMVFRLIDIVHRAELENTTRLMECLELINQSYSEVSKDPAARVCGFDNEGHCLILPGTQRSIAALWQKIVASQAGAADVPTAA